MLDFFFINKMMSKWNPIPQWEILKGNHYGSLIETQNLIHVTIGLFMIK